jgi:hypothetical protein
VYWYWFTCLGIGNGEVGVLEGGRRFFRSGFLGSGGEVEGRAEGAGGDVGEGVGFGGWVGVVVAVGRRGLLRAGAVGVLAQEVGYRLYLDRRGLYALAVGAEGVSCHG